jgi:DNA-binding winged helix-turn-helix (wHTH) protein
VLDVHVRRLRAKVDDPFTTKLIRTVRGVGYVMDDPSAVVTVDAANESGAPVAL